MTTDSTDRFADRDADIYGKALAAFFDDQSVPYFVATSAQLNHGAFGQPRRKEQESIWVDPLTFISGKRSPGRMLAPMPHPVGGRSLTVVAAQYGMGKSKLMRQLCRHLREHGGPTPLPINLAHCRERAACLDRDAPTKAQFLELLFAHLGSAGAEVIAGRPLLGHGEPVLLLLDGLDELVSDRTQHSNFFHGLALLLGDGTSPGIPPLRAVVTARYEYLVAFEFGTEIKDCVKRVAGNAAQVHFLQLDFFTKDNIRSYYQHRTSSPLPKEVADHRKLMELLQRPLLLRIFCDYVINRPEEVFANLDKYATPEKLLWRYLLASSEDSTLKRAQDEIDARYGLDIDALANVCLELFKCGRENLTVNEVGACLRPQTDETPSEVAEEDVWPSIHKCAFLKRQAAPDGTLFLTFAHRSFFEFLVARAMWSKMDKEGSMTEFDDFVLNVDMRKFLHSMLKKEKWHERTRKSYGLEAPEEWAMLGEECQRPDAETLGRLDGERTLLLNLMTNPEHETRHSSAAELATEEEVRFRTVRDFLAATIYPGQQAPDNNRWPHERHHPRYLLYNYEAVAVFLKYHWWDDRASEISGIFESCLRQGVERVLWRITAKEETSEVLREPHALLLERILDIAQRLRYPWVRRFADGSDRDKLDLARDHISPALRERIAAIRAEIIRTA
jgi:hypothetical protein